MPRNTNNITAEQVLRAGYNENRFGTPSLTNSSLTGSAITVPQGILECCVVASLTVTGGTGSIRLILEGSHDATNWHTISQLPESELLTTNGSIAALNADAGSVTLLQRWTFIRVRAVEVTASSYVWSMAILLTGIAHNGERNLQTYTNTRTATSDVSDAQNRAIGGRYATIQVVCTALALGGATSISVDLQGSPDGGTTWIAMGDQISVTATGSQQMTQDSALLADLGHFQNFRLLTQDVGGAATSYTISLYLGVDTSDWFAAIPVGGIASIPSSLLDSLVVIEADTPTAESSNARDVTVRLLSMDGSPLPVQRVIKLILSDTQFAGDGDLATNATFTAVGAGTSIAGLTTNELVVRTTTAGLATVTITDTATETVYLSATLAGVPNTTRFALIQGFESAVAFA